MSVSFRPLPMQTFVCAILFSALVALGGWQLQRLHWKLALIDQVQHNMVAPVLTLDEALARGVAAQYRRVRLEGSFDNDREAYIFGTGVEGAPVFHIVVPFRTNDGRVALVDRGIVPRDLQSRATRSRGVIYGPTTIVGVWRTPDRPGAFTPKPDLARRIWYARDVVAIAQADRVKLVAPTLIEADATPNAGGWPRGGQTRVNFRNEHLQYAITWFLLAAALVGLYLAYHVSQGRLSFGRKTCTTPFQR